ncbi:thioesterase II family protein [Archangium sp.]|uniref:thioesterase II family protein n=1 Tax=Archangium sp. TaxID=1872627 RepID=UPI002D6789AB|nr:thioesterase domain-containing protein [Archangium sp.]HYO51499.1 thioesterase domain-containing protein [Archangium sp.]
MHVPPVYRRWVTCPEPRPRASLRLFCFHFAGGDASIFRLWTTQLPASIEVCPIELPGRATRRAEAPITRFPELLDKMAGMVRPFLKQLPFAFFGHSFGGITAFELTRWMRRNAGPMPVHLFLSACPALHIRQQPAPRISHLSDTEFLEQIATRFGAPREVLASDDVRDTVLPALRADLLVGESYQYAPEPPLDVPISSFGAWEDPEVSQEEAEAWRQQTTVGFRLRMLPGNHFFLAAERRRLHQAILEDLAPQFP